MKEATVGFLREIHPYATLKTDLMEDLNILLQSVDLKPDEITQLSHQTPEEEDAMEETENEIVIPAYDLVNRKFGFSN